MPDALNINESSRGLQSPIRGLYRTPTAPLPFLEGVVVSSFLLKRPQGNIITYNSPGISEAADEIREQGHPNCLFLSHHHEAMYGMPKLDVPVWVHERDRTKTGMQIVGTFSQRQMIDDDLEIIPTPGHTPGSSMFLWDSGEHRLLFPGDALWVHRGQWQAVQLGDSDRDAYIESLTLLKEVSFDILVPWGVERSEPYGYKVSRNEVTENLEEIIARLRAGQTA